MPSHSKYHNLERPPKGWTQHEFTAAVLLVESLPASALVRLVEQLGIQFTGPQPAQIDDEQYISALFDDVDKTELQAALNQYQMTPHIEVLALDPIQDRLERLRMKAHCVATQLSSERGWDARKDARLTAVGKFFNAVMGAELGVVFLGELNDKAWWQAKSADGSVPPDMGKLAFEFHNWIKVGLLTFVNANLESSFRHILRALDPGAAGDATAEWKSIYEAVLARVSVDVPEPSQLLDLLRVLRNTIHNNGVHRSKKGTDLTITYKGCVFTFEHDKTVTFASWDLLLEVAEDAFDLLVAIITAREVSGLPDPVSCEFT